MGIKNKDYPQRRLHNENFDRFVMEAIDNMTIDQKEQIPMDLRPVLQDGGRDALSKMTLETILFLLNVVLGKKLAIVISDTGGLDVASFIKLFDGHRDNAHMDQAMEVLGDDKVFVLGSYDLVGMLEYYNMICAGPTYKALLDYKSGIGKKGKTMQQREQQQNAFHKIVKLLAHYEYYRGRLKEYGLQPAEWFLLMVLSYQEINPRELLAGWAERGQSFDKRYLRHSLSRLVKMGLVQRHGVVNRNGINYYLTPAGRHMLNRVIDQLVLSF